MFEYDPVLYSRILTGLTLAVHTIFSTLGVGVPLLIALAEWIGIKRNDEHYHLLARRWARGYIITVAVGVVTGTAIALQLSLLWPNFMQVAGQTISFPLFLETFAFFFEAIFLGIYLYTWDRFKNKMYHLLLLIPAALGATASGFFITTVNSFMNAPLGFTYENGVLSNINPIAAMFNPATPTKVSHVLSSAYLTSAFVLAAIAAFAILRGRDHVYHKKALHLSMVVAFVFAIVTALVGDLSGKYLANYQPEKLAAAEWHFETMEEASLILGGILTEDNEVKYALEIPYALSILAHGTPGAEVIGLEEYPKEDWPPLVVHYMFDLMVAIGMGLALISFIYIVMKKKKSWNPLNKPLLSLIVAGGPLAMLAIEAGWFFTEEGRQPWIIRGVMRTAEGATTSQHVDIMLYLFAALYVILIVSAVTVLIRTFRANPVEKELKKRGIE
ncbi:cytochrome ubiquinol oxidase subunit I [Priestia flexa]|uniref:Cytochrome ubiquinol oxidase subunit I n=1 Tax=Priestia flexa TaxID=86664 RepID=A0A1N6WBZ7_9BACI|nr:cytochrome ubiquinol oxidase subunit I [Priestia flexa]MBN8252614.1 cytochrome ubiquinol oxidase subunit I [Priestia flexa]MBN8434085.1 cytochrome ubiquinol oxidase subunit I [Priestia flexa]MBY6086175.1 cytochrome ubiquinol oxidase subunit I [Priestia flexa]MCA0966618.1 cytochrome ubiquinol oxidase subunit I [Priestia flexa]MCM3067094.1 cytochrome ubiquinol oxidase subunit I [Priestia flexa]